MSAKEKLLEFVQYAGELFGYDEFDDPELDFEVERIEDLRFPFYSTDLVREEDGEVYRFCLVDAPPPFEEALEFYFEQFRELEAETEEEYDGAVLLLRPDREEQTDFWFLHRTESGEIGLFHSDWSFEDEDEEDGADETEEHTNGYH